MILDEIKEKSLNFSDLIWEKKRHGGCIDTIKDAIDLRNSWSDR